MFNDEVFLSPPQKTYETTKTIFKYIDEISSSHLIDMFDYGLSDNKGSH